MFLLLLTKSRHIMQAAWPESQVAYLSSSIGAVGDVEDDSCSSTLYGPPRLQQHHHPLITVHMNTHKYWPGDRDRVIDPNKTQISPLINPQSDFTDASESPTKELRQWHYKETAVGIGPWKHILMAASISEQYGPLSLFSMTCPLTVYAQLSLKLGNCWSSYRYIPVSNKYILR